MGGVPAASGPAGPAEPHAAAGTRPGARDWALALLVLLGLLIAYRLVPGQLPNAQFLVADAAYAECLHASAVQGRPGCANTGYPAGAPKPFGLPVNLLAAAVFAGDDVVSMGEMRLVYAALFVLAFLLAWRLFTRLVGGPRLGLCGAVLFLLAPALHLQSSFGVLQLGMALLPGYLLTDAWLLRGARARHDGWKAALPRLAGALVLVCAVRVFSLFLDGYSFLLATLLSTCYFMASALRPGARVDALVALALYVGASGVAAALYRGYLGPGGLGVMPVEFFRGAGVDLATMLLPLQWQGGWGLLGLGLDVTPEMTWGGRSSLLGVFVGISSAIAAVVLAWGWATRRIRVEPMAAGILAAGLVAILLSLGPSLKFMDFKPRDPALAAATLGKRMMPAEAAGPDLHTAWIYQNVPGIRNARVLARWQVLTRLAWVVAVLLVAARLMQAGRRGRAASVALLALALFEVFPDPVANAGTGRAALERAEAIHGEYSAAFASGLVRDERVLLLQLHDARGRNEYSTNTLCVRARVRCYNTGGDKASVIVRRQWPEPILDAVRGRKVAANLAAAFDGDLVDVVAIPYFDLRDVVYPHVAREVSRDLVRQRAAALAAEAGLDVVHGTHFSYLRRGP